MEVFNVTIVRPNAPELADLKAPVAPTNLDPRAIDPFHAAMWIQTMCVTDQSSRLSHDSLYTSYCQYCSLFLLNPVPLTELLKLCVKFYKEPSVSFDPPLVIGLRPSIDFNNLSLPNDEDIHNCQIPNCNENFEDNSQLWSHLQTHKLSKSCPLPKCDYKNQSTQPLKHHLKTHLPEPRTESDKITIHPNMYQELRGIPLCALLVIRNIAKNPQNHPFFAPFEKDLATMLTNPKFNRTIASIFAELK
jgi:hypothetical protein